MMLVESTYDLIHNTFVRTSDGYEIQTTKFCKIEDATTIEIVGMRKGLFVIVSPDKPDHPFVASFYLLTPKLCILSLR
jgi:hypothetical protein